MISATQRLAGIYRHVIFTVAASLALAIAPATAQCTTNVCDLVVNETWTLAGSPYCVTCDVRIAGLTIEPGVQVIIDGDYKIEVLSGLHALGTAANPIVFTSTNPDTWQGIKFNGTLPNSQLIHCVIEHSYQGGLEIVNSLPMLQNCTIQNNTNTIGGGGVRIDIDFGNLTLRECTISGNSSATNGGGLHVSADNGSAVVLRGCTVSDNAASPTAQGPRYSLGGGIYFNPTSGALYISECDISGNQTYSYHSSYGTPSYSDSYGAGLYASGGDVSIVASRFCNNVAAAYAYAWYTASAKANGGGVFFTGSGNSLTVLNSIFACNTNPVGGDHSYSSKGSGVCVWDGTANVTNCVFLKNGEITSRNTEAFFIEAGVVDFRNSIFWKNNQLSSSPDAWGDQILGGGTTLVEYCDVMGGYPGSGNIDSDPLFYDESCANPDVHLIPPYSPCIDTGDSFSAYDDMCFPPSLGTIQNDMGAYGGKQACSPAMPAIIKYRNAAPNLNSLTCYPMVLGGSFLCDVDLSGPPSYSFALLLGYLSPLEFAMAGGPVVLTNVGDPSGELLHLTPWLSGGTTATFQRPIPSDPNLCGVWVYMQAIHFNSGSVWALSNACDATIGTY